MSKIENNNRRTSMEEYSAGRHAGRPQRLRSRPLPPDPIVHSPVAPFDFMKCPVISVNGEPYHECPVCEPNFYAYVPDYTLMEPGETFFDGKNCQYCISLAARPPYAGGPSPSALKNPTAVQDKIKMDGIRKLLEYHNKSEVAVVYYYEKDPRQTEDIASTGGLLAGLGIGASIGGILAAPTGGLSVAVGAIIGASIGAISGGVIGEVAIPDAIPGYTLRAEEKNVIEELMDYTVVRYTIPMQKKARTKIAVCVSAEAWERIPYKLETEPASEFEEQLEVSFTGDDFEKMFKHVAGDSPLQLFMHAGAFRLYQKQLHRWSTIDGGQLSTKFGEKKRAHLDLESEANKLIDFYTAVIDMIDDTTGLKISDIERITFEFEPLETATTEAATEDSEETERPRIRLKQITFNKYGCPDLVFNDTDTPGAQQFKRMVNKSPFSRSRSLYYVGALPEIDREITSAQPVPWLEVVLKYTYPSLQIYYGEDSNSLFNDPALGSCLAESLLDEDGVVGALADAMADQIAGLPDAILDEFSNKLCMTKEDREKKNSSFKEDFKDGAKKAYEEAKAEITKGDPYLDAVFSFLEQRIKGKPSKEKIQELHEQLMDRLGWCGWVSLIIKGMDCLMAGMGEEDWKKAIVEHTLGNVGDYTLQLLMLGLPAEDKAKVVAQVDDVWADLPPPWDPSYKIGTYNSPEMSQYEVYDAVMSTEETAYEAQRREEDEALVISAATLEGEIAETEQLIEEIEAGKLYDHDKDPSQILSDEKKKLEELNGQWYDLVYPESVSGLGAGTGLFGIGYSGETGEFSFGEYVPGSGGTYAEALGQTTKALFDAYRGALLDALDVDVLFDEIMTLPGAGVFAGFATTAMKSIPESCRPQPLWSFNPPLDSFMNTREFDFCQIMPPNKFELTFKREEMAEWVSFFGNIVKSMAKAIWKAIQEAAVQIVMSAIKALMAQLMNLACDILKTMGASLRDLYEGSDHFRDLLTESLCPGSSDDQLNESLKNLFATVDGNSDCLATMPNEEMGAFIDDMSLMLTQGQLLQLFKGSANRETVELALEVARTSSSECIREIFSNAAAIRDFFSSLGLFVPVDDLMLKLRSETLQLPATHCPPEVMGRINDLKCGLLSQKGLDPQECREELDKLKEKAIQDFKDMADMLQNGPLSNFPSTECSECSSDSFYPCPDPMDLLASDSINSMYLASIESAVVSDLLGYHGVLNCILSDSKGRGLRSHNRRVRFMGAPLASQLGLFEWEVDNAIEHPETDASVDIYGSALADNQGDSVIAKLGGGAKGGFPPTVGAWMARKFRDLDPEFKTSTVPDGYSSLREAVEDIEKRKARNETRIEQRSNYVEAFIMNYKLGSETSGDGPELASLLRAGIYSSSLLKDAPSRQKGEGLSDAVQVTEALLLGESISCCGFWNHSAVFTEEKTNPKNWSSHAQELAGTRGKPFFKYHKSLRLDQVPDIMTPDVQIRYWGHEHDPNGNPAYAFRLGYDYNLPDENGAIKRQNSYQIKIVVDQGASIRSGVESVASYRPHSYTLYDFEVTPKLDQDTMDFINTLPVSKNVRDSWQVEVLYRAISQRIIDAAGSNREKARNAVDKEKFRDYFAASTNGARKFDLINAGFLKRISNRILTGRSYPEIVSSMDAASETGFLEPPREVESDISTHMHSSAESKNGPILAALSEAFKFGYSENTWGSPEIIYLDNETYGGPLGKLFPEQVPPPFYVQEPDFKGWRGIVEAIVPPEYGCQPAPAPLFSLGDLIQEANMLEGNLEEDPRFEYDPLCSQEAPYDKMFDGSTAASIDAVQRSVIRVYLTEALIRGMPIISQFALNEDNFEEGLYEFITERIKRGLMVDGITGWWIFNDKSNDDDYYYRFIEQTFNNIVRKVDSGIIDPNVDFTLEEKIAFKNIVEHVQEFYEKYDGKLAALSAIAIENQSWLKNVFDNTATKKFGGISAGSADFSKTAAEKSKQAAFELMINQTIDSALVFVKRMVKEEFLTIADSFNARLAPDVENVDFLLFLSDTWTRGGVQPDGPIHVQSNPNSKKAYNIPTGDPESYQSAMDQYREAGLNSFASSFRSAFSNMDEWPFVLEKYIKIIEKPIESADEYDATMERENNLYNIVNIDDWDKFVQKKKSMGVTGKISDYWGAADIEGETTQSDGSDHGPGHTHRYEVDEFGNGIALEVCHDGPAGASVCHWHKIVNFKVQEAIGTPSEHSHEIEVHAWKFGLRLSFMPENNNHAKEIWGPAIGSIRSDTIMEEKAYKLKSPQGERYLIPIASAELDIPDQEFTLFNPDSYDVYCLIREIVEKPEYKAWFRYVFPLPRFLSLLTIYCMQGFYDSLGNEGMPEDGGDMWETKGGNIFSGFRSWDRQPEDCFEKSKTAAMDAFTNIYEAAQSANPHGSGSRKLWNLESFKFADWLRPVLNFEDGLRWWERGRRIKKRPYNSYGESCD